MEKIYSDLSNPAGLGSIKKLYKEIKKRDKNVRVNDVKKFLSGKPSYTLNKLTRKKFPRRKFIFKKPGIVLAADVTYVKYYMDTNDPYILILMDAYSRYVWAYPIKTINSCVISKILDNFFKNSIYNFEKLFTDGGKEFVNKKVNKICEKYNIERYSTFQRDIKVSFLERFNRTLKEKIARYVVHFNNEKYSDVLHTFIQTYNYTNHQYLLGKSPTDVYLQNDWEQIKKISRSIYRKHSKKIKSVVNRLSRGQVVRIKNETNVFSRVYNVKNSYELFKVDKININHVPVTYLLKDLEGKKIDGIFYREELVEVDDDGLYSLSVIKKKKRKSGVFYLIKYDHYPDCEAVWIHEKQLKKLN